MNDKPETECASRNNILFIGTPLFFQRRMSLQQVLFYHSVDIDRDLIVCIRNDRTENVRIAQDFEASFLIRL